MAHSLITFSKQINREDRQSKKSSGANRHEFFRKEDANAKKRRAPQ
jgi:hypothetical protein